jgi:hypothetical protein
MRRDFPENYWADRSRAMRESLADREALGASVLVAGRARLGL